jgi:hypothetical protein
MEISDCDILTVIIPVHRVFNNFQDLKLSMLLAHESECAIKFILVQDGDDDFTKKELLKLSELYGAEYVNVSVSSPGLARNAGLERVKTKWVAFWDSDDFGHAVNSIDAIQSAPVNCMAIVGGYEVRTAFSYKTLLTNKPCGNLPKLMLNPGLWRFIFRTDFIGDLRFKDLEMGEDQVFLCELCLEEETVYRADTLLYIYHKEVPGQLTSKESALGDLVLAITELLKLTEVKKYNLPYIQLVRLKLILTALKGKQIKISNLLLLIAHISKSPTRSIYSLLASFFRFGFYIALGKFK